MDLRVTEAVQPGEHALFVLSRGWVCWLKREDIGSTRTVATSTCQQFGAATNAICT
jgi:hypothetical protein